MKTLLATLLALAVLPTLVSCAGLAPEEPPAPRGPLERSFWVHASLGQQTNLGYWGPNFPPTPPPTQAEVHNAATLLTGTYHANRLYLIYNHEMSVGDAQRVFLWWKQAVPPDVEIVPALVLKMYDKRQTSVFGFDELLGLARFFRQSINPQHVAIFDVYANRNQGPGLGLLAEQYPGGLIRLGLQPGEAIGPPFVQGVEDTWTAFCDGRRNEQDWMQPGFGADKLRQWVSARNRGSIPIAWDLVVVAWDYRPTRRGSNPGYDNGDLNMPLPQGRNRLGMQLIRQTARPSLLAGFSSDLSILQADSRSPAHDGEAGAFYRTLREGQPYQGYYAGPFWDIVGLYDQLGREPGPQPSMILTPVPSRPGAD